MNLKIEILRLLDRSAVLLALLLGLIKQKPQPPKRVNKILLVKLWAVGDAIVSTPLIERIKKVYPRASITVLCKPELNFIYKQHAKVVNPTLSFLKKYRSYDLVFDLEPFSNISALITFWAGKFRIGFNNQTRSRLYNLHVSFKQDELMAEHYLKMLSALTKKKETLKVPVITTKKTLQKKFLPKKKRRVVLAPFISGSVNSREWPYYKELITELKKENWEVLIIGSKADEKRIKHLGNELGIGSYTNLPWEETAALLSTADLFIGNDSGPMHLAASVKTPTIGIFGPNTPKVWHPLGKKTIALYKPPVCSPCIRNDSATFRECIYKNTPRERQCLKNIKVKDIKEAIKQLEQNEA